VTEQTEGVVQEVPCEKNSRNMKVWYDSGWSVGRPTYSSMLKVTTCLNLKRKLKYAEHGKSARRSIRYFALLVKLDEPLICWYGRGACWETEYKGLFC